MSQISAKYTLRRFTNSTDKDYQKALLDIYQNNIEPDSKTNSNEITCWLDEYGSNFEDEFCVCGFYSGSKIIGFAEFVYFKKKRLLFFDYLVLHKACRHSGEFFQFAKLIQDWIHRERFEFDYAVAEVSYDSGTDMPSDKSIHKVELFKWMGFMVADCRYHQPLLGLNNPESDKRAHLLIASHESINSIRRDTLLRIINTVVFDHYERWYKKFQTPAEQFHYHHHLTECVKHFEQGLTEGVIELNGIKMGFDSGPLPPPPPPTKTEMRQILAPLVSVGVILAFCVALLILKSRFGITQISLLEIVATSLIVFTVSFALIHPKGKPVLKELCAFIIKFFGREK